MSLLRTSIVPMALGLALTVAASASAQTAPDDEPSPAVPNGNGCAGAVARWQEFAGRESQGGHMDEAVYNQIQNEIDRASHLCEAGQDAQARKAVAESKRRHGY